MEGESIKDDKSKSKKRRFRIRFASIIRTHNEYGKAIFKFYNQIKDDRF